MVSPEIIEQEGKRFLDMYFKVDRIKDSKNPYKEFMRQAKRMKGLGIISEVKNNYTIANKLFKKIGLGSLRMKEYKVFDFGIVHKSITEVLRGVAKRTGKRQIVSKYAGKVKAWEKWRDNRVRKVMRDSKGRFVKRK